MSVRFSVYTPTNNVRWLDDAYESLKAQTFKDWEWIVVPNYNVSIGEIGDIVGADPRVKIIPSKLSGVGALKGFAVSQCTGEICVELDHDDQLTTDCLQELDAAATKTPDGFYYSDFASVLPDGRSEVYGNAYGWENYPYKFGKETFTAMRAFSATARALAEIYYAPNHVRAFSKTAYIAMGGYDTTLTIGDDHDLICRFYLSGIPMVHIDKCLYIYRSHPGSTCRTDNGNVQKQQTTNRDRFLHPLILEECRRNNWAKLEMSLDRGPTLNGNIKQFQVLDQFPCVTLPFEDNAFGIIWVTDIVQRYHPSLIPILFNELYRVLRPGGYLLIKTPATDDGEGKIGRGAFQDFNHLSYWSANSFFYFTHREFAKHTKNYKGRFQTIRSYHAYPSDWHKANFIPYVYADLMALKGQRAAGLTTI